MKLDRALWESIQKTIDGHPEWGMLSVPEFVRRAIDSEMRLRRDAESSRVISLQITPAKCRKSS